METMYLRNIFGLVLISDLWKGYGGTSTPYKCYRSQAAENRPIEEKQISRNQPRRLFPYDKYFQLSPHHPRNFHSHIFQTIVTFKIHSFPTSSLHPNVTASFRKSNRFSRYFSSFTLEPASSLALRPRSCSHASSDHISLPLVMAPLSSTRSPTWK